MKIHMEPATRIRSILELGGDFRIRRDLKLALGFF